MSNWGVMGPNMQRVYGVLSADDWVGSGSVNAVIGIGRSAVIASLAALVAKRLVDRREVRQDQRDRRTNDQWEYRRHVAEGA